MSYAAGRTDGKEPCKQSPHCVGSWEEVWIKTTESHTVLAIGQQRKNCNSENRETQKKKIPECCPHPSSDSSLEILKWWRKENRAMCQEANLQPSPMQHCSASNVTGGHPEHRDSARSLHSRPWEMWPVLLNGKECDVRLPPECLRDSAEAFWILKATVTREVLFGRYRTVTFLVPSRAPECLWLELGLCLTLLSQTPLEQTAYCVPSSSVHLWLHSEDPQPGAEEFLGVPRSLFWCRQYLTSVVWALSGKGGQWFYLFLKQIYYLKLVESHRSASCNQKKKVSVTQKMTLWFPDVWRNWRGHQENLVPR